MPQLSEGSLPRVFDHQEADAVFDFLDSSGDGQLEPEELAAGLHKLGAPEQGVRQLFRQLDSSGNGYVNRATFRTGFLVYRRYIVKHEQEMAAQEEEDTRPSLQQGKDALAQMLCDAATMEQHKSAPNLAKAENFYRQALEGTPSHPQTLLRYGVMLIKMGRAAEAMPLLEQCAMQGRGPEHKYAIRAYRAARSVLHPPPVSHASQETHPSHSNPPTQSGPLPPTADAPEVHKNRTRPEQLSVHPQVRPGSQRRHDLHGLVLEGCDKKRHRVAKKVDTAKLIQRIERNHKKWHPESQGERGSTLFPPIGRGIRSTSCRF